MAPVLIAKVALENVSYHFDKAYDYCVPESLRERARPGCRVSVPFGRGNQKRFGMLFSLSEEEPSGRLKQLSCVLDEEPLLNANMLRLAVWLKAHTFCTLYEAVRTILPSGINLRHKMQYRIAPEIGDLVLDTFPSDEREVLQLLHKRQAYVGEERIMQLTGLEKGSDVLKKQLVVRNDEAAQRIGDATVRMVRLCVAGEELEQLLPSLTQKQRAVMDVLLDVGCASVKELCYFTGVTPAVVAALEKKNLIDYYENEIYRDPARQPEAEQVPQAPICLTRKQQAAFEELNAQYRLGRGGVSLLFGVTGSGKTQVFLRMIDEVSAQGRGVIVMVPEIALTPQTLAIFKGRYGKQVAVFHSALSMGERMDEWKRVKNGEAGIVVGTRCAVFAPFENLGLIIMDEEQEHTYKSESAPRYHARDVAKFRCAQQNALLILASATPSVESYAAAKSGRYSLNRLDERYGNAVLPEVITVDLCEENAAGNRTAISRRLAAELQKNLEAGEQSILLMNRRGYHTFVACRSCGHVVTCPNCSISLTYHRANGRLMCHYCGYTVPQPKICPSCGSPYIAPFGTGTQKIEEMTRQMFPAARVLRMDLDTTSKKGGHQEILSSFARGEADILIGTQMIVKGHDFPRVTLVGALAADLSLYAPDYRCGEQTFALLTQAAGRAGRAGEEGVMVIQTYRPDHYAVVTASGQDYGAFYEQEMAFRRLLGYPPAVGLLIIQLSSADEALLESGAERLAGQIRAMCGEGVSGALEVPVQFIGPVNATVYKVNDIYRKILYIKHENYDILIQIRKNSEEFIKGAEELKNISAQYDLT